VVGERKEEMEKGGKRKQVSKGRKDRIIIDTVNKLRKR
jgi:hypothetical protein